MTFFVILVIFRFGFEGWIWVLIASFPYFCILLTCKNVSAALSYLLNNFYIIFGKKVIQTNCCIPVGKIVLLLWPICLNFCYERYFIFSPDDNQANCIEAFNSTSRYLDDLLNLNMDTSYFEGMVKQTAVE